MSHEEPIDPDAPLQEDPSAAPTMYFAIMGILITVISVIFVHWMYYAVDAGIEADVFAQPVVEYENLKTEQQERLREYRWIQPSDEKAKRWVGLPGDEAARRVIEKYGK